VFGKETHLCLAHLHLGCSLGRVDLAVIADGGVCSLLLEVVLDVVVLCAHHPLMAGHRFLVWDPFLIIEICSHLWLVVNVPFGGMVCRNTRKHGLVICHYDCIVSAHFSNANIDIAVQKALVVLLFHLFVLLEILRVL
jgi:hypothetical protein